MSVDWQICLWIIAKIDVYVREYTWLCEARHVIGQTCVLDDKACLCENIDVGARTSIDLWINLHNEQNSIR